MKILFQGDSITDAGRNRADIHDLGFGYPLYAAELIRNAYPEEEFEFVDLGISGNRTEDLIARLDTDFLSIGADVVSVLIGVNDTWHRMAERDFISCEQFADNLKTIFSAVKNSGAKLIVLEPYLVPLAPILPLYDDLWRKILVYRTVAAEYADAYVPLDGLFFSASVDNGALTYSADGVHPNAEGAKFIARHYKDAFDKIYGSLKGEK